MQHKVRIPANSAETPRIHLAGGGLVAIITPVGMQGDSLKIQGSLSGGTWFDTFDTDGEEFVIASGPARMIVVDEYATAGVPYIRLVADVVQNAARDLVVEVSDR